MLKQYPVQNLRNSLNYECMRNSVVECTVLL